MNILVLTKNKIYITPKSLTIDSILVYSPDALFGIKWKEIDELSLVGFKSDEDFSGQKLVFPQTRVHLIGLDAAYEKREISLAGRLKNALDFFFLIIRQRKELQNVDVLITAYFEYTAFMLLAVRIANPRIKIINDVIGDYPLWNFQKRKSYIQKIYLIVHQYFSYLLSDDVWFISRFLFLRYPSRKGSVLYNSPLSEKQIGSPKKLSSPPKLLFVGRFSEEKCPDIPLLILDQLRKDGYDAELCFVGSGPLEETIKTLTHSLGLDNKVTFMGRILDRERLFRIYGEYDFFIFPSLLGEALGFVALEAMSQGSVVLATTCGGVSEVIEDGKSGVLVPVEAEGQKINTAMALAKRAEELISDPVKYGEISKRAVERSADFTIEKCGIVQRRHILALLGKKV